MFSTAVDMDSIGARIISSPAREDKGRRPRTRQHLSNGRSKEMDSLINHSNLISRSASSHDGRVNSRRAQTVKQGAKRRVRQQQTAPVSAEVETPYSSKMAALASCYAINITPSR